MLAIGPGSPVAATADSGRDSTAGAAGRRPPGRFYRGLAYGSEAEFGPLNQLLNEGFDILQIEGRNRRMLSFDYGRNARESLASITSAASLVRAYGSRNFLRDEILPLSDYHSGGAQWVPNYELHLLGAGMVSARMTEWYEAHDVPHAGLASAVTIMASHLLNEMTELNGQRRNAGLFADLAIFDPAGILLFRSEHVRRFFSETIQLTNWGLQPMVAFPGATVENTGQWYTARFRVPGRTRWSLFTLMGMGGLFGASHDDGMGGAISVGIGGGTFAVKVIDTTTHRETVRFRGQFGAFYDRNGSLLASLRYQSTGAVAWNANFYPGAFHLGAAKPGLWVQVVRPGGARIGIAASWLQGVGIGMISHRPSP
jgi:hypothetical protein